MTVSRRAVLGGFAALVAGAPVLAACGTDSAAPTGAATSAAATGAEDGAFPVTITHRFGETTIDAAPVRIVTVGLKEQDDLLALGIVPVGSTKWLDLPDDGVIGPWADDALGDAAAPTALDATDAIQFEAIAGLAPDLILALYAGLKQADYDKLTEIAPVVCAPEEYVDYGIPWDAEAEIVGRAVGQPTRMTSLIETSKKALSDAVDPAFTGGTSMVVTPYEGIYVYGAQDPRVRLMTDLGFVLPDGLQQALGKNTESFGGNISAERADIMDVDALICFADAGEQQAAIETKLFRQLDVSLQGRVVWLRSTDQAYNPFSFLTVLSLPYLLESFVYRVKAAVDGDPDTSTEQTA